MRRLIAVLCLAEVLTMLAVFTFPALLPTFQETWALSNTEAGWVSGIYFAAYAVAAPVLVTLTDRIDARWIYAASAGLGALAALGFAVLADGFADALVFRALGGVALAGTYMPGLRMLVDRVDERQRPRAVPFYTASFSLGTAASYFVAGELGAVAGWRWAFGVAALGAAAAAVLALLQRPSPPSVPPSESERAPGQRLLDLRPVLRNRPAMGYILGYAVHTWELFAFRSWVVAFLAAAAVAHGGPEGETPGWLAPSTVATLGALVAMAASILGAEAATRLGRTRTVAAYMLASAAGAAGLGFAVGLPYPVVAGLTLLYAGLVQLDSAALTTGAVEAARPGRRGATLAVHSLLGFLAGWAGPLAVGAVLDAGGSWGWAFLSVAVVGLLGPPVLLWGARRSTPAAVDAGRPAE